MAAHRAPIRDRTRRTAQAERSVDVLERSKHRFAPADRAAKRAALAAIAEQPIWDGALLLRLHEVLCFLRAYPDDAEILAEVEVALAAFSKRIDALRAAGRAREAEVLDETGIAGTVVYCPASHAAARWLTDRFPESVEIDWEDEENEARLGSILPLAVGLIQEDALTEVHAPYRAWLAAVNGNDATSDVAWILYRLRPSQKAGEARQALYTSLAIRLRWELGEGQASRTLAKVAVPRVFFHRGALTRWRGSLPRRLPGAPIPARHASSGEGEELLDAARAAVLVRYREVHGFNGADPNDVVVADMGRGVQLAWFGLVPEHRLPVRAHYGYLFFKNGIPVGYGDASLLFDWVELAYNIFDTFRQGESAFIFARLCAFLYQRFGTRAFRLDRYQLGYRNDEALASGAFWFYYKLGFRPRRRDLLRLARDERRRIAREPAYRSSRETLTRLCQDEMFLHAGTQDALAVRGFEIRRVALRGAAEAARGGRRAVAAVSRALGATERTGWEPSERVAFDRMAPVLAAIPDLSRWSTDERRALAAIVRAKGGPREAEYLSRLRTHPRLRASFLRLGSPGCA